MSLDFMGQGWRGTCTAAPSATTRLLAWTSRNAIPMAISVHVKGNTLSDGANNPRSTLAQYLLCDAVVGGIAKQFQVDLRSGGAAFDIVCESLTIYVVNGDPDAADALFCFGAITRYVQGAPWRAPTRTVRAVYAVGVPQTIDVPRYSGRFTILRSGTTVFTYDCLDSDGVAIATIPGPSTNAVAPIAIALPGGSDRIACTPAANGAINFIFELAL